MGVVGKGLCVQMGVSVSTNMLGVTPSNTLSVKVILQITWWSLLSTKYLHSFKQATAFDESESV